MQTIRHFGDQFGNVVQTLTAILSVNLSPNSAAD